MPIAYSKEMLVRVVGTVLCLFLLAEVNHPHLGPQTQLAIFGLLGLVLVFGTVPLHRQCIGRLWRGMDAGFVLLTIVSFGYFTVQFDPLFSRWWIDGQSLGDRAGQVAPIDIAFGAVGLVLVLEAARRTVGATLPLLAMAFLGYAAWGPSMPDWFFPHRGYTWARIVEQTVLQSQGVFGIALQVMFTYVFLFVLFGTLLEQTGATDAIIRGTRRLFHKSPGGPAKVAVISSGLMGSLSGSAVANTATTGTFTIPLMRSSGFSRSVAGGIEAAASSGGALMPPIMGAGAYMMLEILAADTPTTFMDIMKAAIIPALMYYAALVLSVHFYARRIGVEAEGTAGDATDEEPIKKAPLVVFGVAFLSLIVLLVSGLTPFRAVSVTLVVIIVAAAFHRDTRISAGGILKALADAARAGMPLVAAAACVGIVIGIVTLTGIGAKLPGVILPLAENNLLLALALLMVSTIILGMGLPSAVCYLLMATLVGPVLGDLGVERLAAHLFIFYFGMMSMVTPPVALAAYTASAIADAPVMKTAMAGFRFALIGFVLPYAFVLHPELLLIPGTGGVWAVVAYVLRVCLALIPLAAGIGGFWRKPLAVWARIGLVVGAIVLMLAESVVGIGIGACLAGGILLLKPKARLESARA